MCIYAIVAQTRESEVLCVLLSVGPDQCLSSLMKLHSFTRVGQDMIKQDLLVARTPRTPVQDVPSLSRIQVRGVGSLIVRPSGLDPKSPLYQLAPSAFGWSTLNVHLEWNIE